MSSTAIGFRLEGLTEAFRKFSRFSKIGVFRPHSPASYLPYSPLCPQSCLHIKRYSRPRSSKELHKREKYQISPILNTRNYADKKNDYRARPESVHRPLSQLPQERKRQGHEKAVLRQGLPVGTLWQLHLQCFRRAKNLLSSNHLKLFNYV